jgi:hypothetical protein
VKVSSLPIHWIFWSVGRELFGSGPCEDNLESNVLTYEIKRREKDPEHKRVTSRPCEDRTTVEVINAYL